MGAAGPFAAIVFTFGWIGFLILPIIILIGWSRIKLKCHSFTQVAAGLFFAFVSVYFQMSLIIKYFVN
jgi:membrane-associated phospholipid phosphatase